MKGKPASGDREREIPAPKADPGMRETDDHVMSGVPRGDTQPVDDLDPGVDGEHLHSPSQGVRPER
jgi:hypothetical protein